ncbi:MAG: hypothetical protein BYD32DRAFT_462624 [Podila humilis]|nr:MAG: hypothetical protein BYD32DRAFT_462624 [Podila humilis]
MASNTLAVTCPSQTLVTISCLAPRTGQQTIVQASLSSKYNLVWRCIVTNQEPQLDITLVWSVNRAFEFDFPPPRGIRSLQVISQNGVLVGSAPVKGLVNGIPLAAKVNMAAVQIKERLEFDILLSTCISTVQIPRPKSAVTRLKYVMASLMGDIATTNMAFTFGYNGSARNIAIWAHQSILQQIPSFHSLISKLKDFESDPFNSGALSSVKTAHVTEYSLEAYCALIRYIYCDTIDLHINLDHFPIGRAPTKPFSISCKERLVIDGPFWPTVPVSKRPPSTRPSPDNVDLHHHLDATWEELFQLADCYQVEVLRAYCQEQIVDGLDSSTVLDVLFRYAYRYPDLKESVLEFVANSITELYAKSKDPFAAYAEHPHRHELMSEALRLVFMAKAQIKHS